MDIENYNKNLIASISSCLNKMVSINDARLMIEFILTEMLNISKCECGFVAEVNALIGKDTPKYISIVGDKLTEHLVDEYTVLKNSDKDVEMLDLTSIYSIVYRTKDVVIINDVAKDSRKDILYILPSEMNFINNFTGVPILDEDKLIAMVSVMNLNGTFSDEYLSCIKPYLDLIKFIFINKRRTDNIDNSKNRFLLHMSHEFKTPLNGIIGMTEQLIHTDPSSAQLDLLESISQCNLRLINLINDMMDYYKMSMGYIEIKYTTVNVESVIKEVYNLYSEEIKQKNLKFNYKIDTNVPNEILMDKQRLTQILFNLVSNAIKYTNNGSVSVEVHCDSTKSDDKLTHISFDVNDTGVGIETNRLKHIFDLFHNISGSLLVEEHTGHGFGLAICKMLVEFFKGKIKMKSTLNKGTSVNFFIECKSMDDIKNIKDHIYSKLKGTYMLVIIKDDSKYKPILNEISFKIGVVPIIVNNINDAVTFTNINSISFSTVIVSEEFINSSLLINLKIKYVNITIMALSFAKPYSNALYIDKFLGYTIDEHSLIRNIYDFLKYDVGNITLKYKSIKNKNIDILVVEDEILNLKMISTYLTKLEFKNVDTANDGLMMYNRMLDKKYDIVLTDIKMPIKDGYTAVREIIEYLKKNNKPIPVFIAITALEDINIQQNCDRAGIKYLIKKPYTITDLIKVLNTVIVD